MTTYVPAFHQYVHQWKFVNVYSLAQTSYGLGSETYEVVDDRNGDCVKIQTPYGTMWLYSHECYPVEPLKNPPPPEDVDARLKRLRDDNLRKVFCGGKDDE